MITFKITRGRTLLGLEFGGRLQFDLDVRGGDNPTKLSEPLQDAITNTPGFNLNVNLPQTTGIYVIPGFPRVARRVLNLLAENSTVEGRMLRFELNVALKLPGRDDSVGVFNRRDYLASGGEALADLAESLFMEAVGESAWTPPIKIIKNGE